MAEQEGILRIAVEVPASFRRRFDILVERSGRSQKEVVMESILLFEARQEELGRSKDPLREDL